MEIQVPNRKTVYLFNCDNTFKLDSVEALLATMRGKLEFEISIKQHCFKLSEMSHLSDSIVPSLQMDFAIFVVHANESRLSINEDNAGIGYAKIYKALLKATGEKVMIIIGGDDNYVGKEEEKKAVMSRWARKKVSSQFEEEYLDGRKSFVFSWHKSHREVHEKALLHFFNPSKRGERFDYHLPEMSPPAVTTNATAEEKDQGLNPQPEITPSTPSNSPENISLYPTDEVEHVNEFEASYNKGMEEVIIVVGPRDQIPAGRLFNYPEGSVLLDTRLRYGEVSDDAKDVVHRENGWQVPEGYRDHLRSIHAAENNLRVKFVVRQNQLTTIIIRNWFGPLLQGCCTIL
ncbi:uncharacterized protein LOC111341869 [Stylophora pistillata]|uniref:uncharacterized protein LOC111341869 n=1 Tax=Stylophora pistillata TaxID=50429 RepID=UPI000C03B885|nr:uncharacterized protein LOC111341869 [Stylophora pistillata]